MKKHWGGNKQRGPKSRTARQELITPGCIGRVRMFNPTKGWGFLCAENMSQFGCHQDIFLHQKHFSEQSDAPVTFLGHDNAKDRVKEIWVAFDLNLNDPNKPEAVNVRRAEAPRSENVNSIEDREKRIAELAAKHEGSNRYGATRFDDKNSRFGNNGATNGAAASGGANGNAASNGTNGGGNATAGSNGNGTKPKTPDSELPLGNNTNDRFDILFVGNRNRLVPPPPVPPPTYPATYSSLPFQQHLTPYFPANTAGGYGNGGASTYGTTTAPGAYGTTTAPGAYGASGISGGTAYGSAGTSAQGAYGAGANGNAGLYGAGANTNGACGNAGLGGTTGFGTAGTYGTAAGVTPAQPTWGSLRDAKLLSPNGGRFRKGQTGSSTRPSPPPVPQSPMPVITNSFGNSPLPYGYSPIPRYRTSFQDSAVSAGARCSTSTQQLVSPAAAQGSSSTMSRGAARTNNANTTKSLGSERDRFFHTDGARTNAELGTMKSFNHKPILQPSSSSPDVLRSNSSADHKGSPSSPYSGSAASPVGSAGSPYGSGTAKTSPHLRAHNASPHTAVASPHAAFPSGASGLGLFHHSTAPPPGMEGTAPIASPAHHYYQRHTASLICSPYNYHAGGSAAASPLTTRSTPAGWGHSSHAYPFTRQGSTQAQRHEERTLSNVCEDSPKSYTDDRSFAYHNGYRGGRYTTHDTPTLPHSRSYEDRVSSAASTYHLRSPQSAPHKYIGVHRGVPIQRLGSSTQIEDTLQYDKPDIPPNEPFFLRTHSSDATLNLAPSREIDEVYNPPNPGEMSAPAAMYERGYSYGSLPGGYHTTSHYHSYPRRFEDDNTQFLTSTNSGKEDAGSAAGSGSGATGAATGTATAGAAPAFNVCTSAPAALQPATMQASLSTGCTTGGREDLSATLPTGTTIPSGTSYTSNSSLEVGRTSETPTSGYPWNNAPQITPSTIDVTPDKDTQPAYTQETTQAV